MADFLDKLTEAANNTTKQLPELNSALTEAANNTTKQLPELNSALTEAANNTTKQLPELNSALETATKVKEIIQDKPTLEDSVRESLLKVIVNPKFSEQIESDIATVFRPILKMQLEKVGKIIANADEAKTPEQAKAVEAVIETAMNNGSKLKGSNNEEVDNTEGSVPEGSVPEGSVPEGSDTKDSNAKKPVSPKDIVSANNVNLEFNGGSKHKNRNKSRKSLKKSASRGRRTTRRHKRTSR
jgi:hypothetical protein